MSSPFCRCRDYDERATAISTSRTEYADLFGGQPLVARRAVWTAGYTFAAHGHLTKTGVGHRFYAAERQGLAGRPHPLEQGQRAGLVERLIQVAALGALDAGRAAEQAWAPAQHPRRVLDPAFEGLEAALGDPDAAGVAVVDEDCRRPGLEMNVGREAADVPAVAHRPEGEQRDQGVLGRM